jgi:hypothetical protein
VCLRAPFNGQVIDAGQADAAPIHRTHHSNERPVGGATSGHAEDSVSAAGTPQPILCITTARARARVINYWHQGANVLPVSLPTTPSEITRKIRPEQPEDAMWFPLVFAQSKLAFWGNVTNGNKTGTRAQSTACFQASCDAVELARSEGAMRAAAAPLLPGSFPVPPGAVCDPFGGCARAPRDACARPARGPVAGADFAVPPPKRLVDVHRPVVSDNSKPFLLNRTLDHGPRARRRQRPPYQGVQRNDMATPLLPKDGRFDPTSCTSFGSS